jgi:hypothetical protein
VAEAGKNQEAGLHAMQAAQDSLTLALDAASKERNTHYQEKLDSEAEMLEIITKELPGIGSTVTELVGRALNAINEKPQIYPLYAEAIQRQKWAKGKKTGQAELTSQVQRLLDLGILAEKTKGHYTLEIPESQLGRYGAI